MLSAFYRMRKRERERESPNISFLPPYVGCGEIFVDNGVNVAKFCTRQKRPKNMQDLNIFFYVGSPKEDIFSGHLLSAIFLSTLHITITSLCLCVELCSLAAYTHI